MTVLTFSVKIGATRKCCWHCYDSSQRVLISETGAISDLEKSNWFAGLPRRDIAVHGWPAVLPQGRCCTYIRLGSSHPRPFAESVLIFVFDAANEAL